jgi:hypothetical protein
MTMAPDEALYCLQGIAAACHQRWAPTIAERRAELTDEQLAGLLDRLALLAGLDPTETRRCIGA